MKSSVKKNYIYNLIYQILVILLPLITAPYVSRVLGAENIGIYSYTTSIASYFILLGSLGIALYGQREIAYYQNENKKFTQKFWEIFILKAITLSISTIIFYFSFVYRTNEYNIYYMVLLIEIIGNIFDISWFFQGLEEFKKTVLRNIFIKILCLILIFTFVKTEQDLIKYFFINVISLFLGNLSLWLYLPKYLVRVRTKDLNIIKHLKPILILFIPEIAIQIYTLLDKTMIGAIYADKSEVGFYEQSQKIIKLLLTVVTSLGTVLLPRIANFFANNKKEEVYTYIRKSFNYVYILAFPMIFGIIAVAKEFVPLFFGPGYDKVVILMGTISPILLFIGMSNVIGRQYLLPTKRQKEYTISVVVGAVINFIANSCLIWRLGALGASIGTIIAEFTVTLVQLIFVRNEFNIKEIIFLSRNYLIASIIMYGVCKLVGIIPVATIVSLILQVVIGAMAYILILLVIKDQFTYDILNQIKGKVLGKLKNKE